MNFDVLVIYISIALLSVFILRVCYYYLQSFQDFIIRTRYADIHVLVYIHRMSAISN